MRWVKPSIATTSPSWMTWAIASRSVTISGIDRKPYVVFSQAGGGRAGAHDIGKPRELKPMLRPGVAPREPVQHRRHPVGKILRAPDPAQARVGVAIEPRLVAGAIRPHQRAGQVPHVTNRKVQSLRTGRRNDVRRVAGQ